MKFDNSIICSLKNDGPTGHFEYCILMHDKRYGKNKVPNVVISLVVHAVISNHVPRYAI